MPVVFPSCRPHQVGGTRRDAQSETYSSCRHCKSVMQSGLVVSHEMSCRLHGKKCGSCGVFVQQRQWSGFLGRGHEAMCPKGGKCRHCGVFMQKGEVAGHEMSCRLNGKKCGSCGVFVQQREWTRFFGGHHTVCSKGGKCHFCAQCMSTSQMDLHESRCSMNGRNCRHCNKFFQQLQIGSHESSCSSATPTFHDGQTITAYHGTKPDRAVSILREQRFRPSVGGTLGAGVYCSENTAKARTYGTCIFELRVTVGHMKRVLRPDKSWQNEGYDSVSYNGGLTEICVKDPKHIVIVRQIQ